MFDILMMMVAGLFAGSGAGFLMTGPTVMLMFRKHEFGMSAMMFVSGAFLIVIAYQLLYTYAQI